MPINIPSSLPAFKVLRDEGVMVMSQRVAERQDIRPLQIGLLNLMPLKIVTETQFARLIGATPLQIELSLIRMTYHQSKTTSAKHLEAFYMPFTEAKQRKFDGLIITGAPIECLDYEQVNYWDEFCEVVEWTQTHVHSTWGVCWAGMAMLYYWYAIPKYILNAKKFGCFTHANTANSSPYLQGFTQECTIPVSRWTELRQSDLNSVKELTTLLGSPETGPCLIEDSKHRSLCILNHFEYDSDTLRNEYERDIEKGQKIDVPKNYFPNNDPGQVPLNTWRTHGHLLYANWINQIYQTVPFDLQSIGNRENDSSGG